MRSSEVATQAGVNIQTLRYYEKRGILRSPQRSSSGYRSYDAQAVRTVRFIKCAQELGFSLREADALLALAAGGPRNCNSARRLATEKIGELEEKIARLSFMRDSLHQLVETCDLSPSRRECPILDAIDDYAGARETAPGDTAPGHTQHNRGESR